MGPDKKLLGQVLAVRDLLVHPLGEHALREAVGRGRYLLTLKIVAGEVPEG
jgi:hypothetical protein